MRIDEVALIRKDLKTVQDGLVSEFVQDRKNVSSLKEQIKDARRELKSELKAVKAVMTSLFEVQQQAMMS